MIRVVMILKTTGLIFLGAGAGGVMRYLLGAVLNPLFAAIPLGTLAANVLGCGAAGGLVALLVQRSGLDANLRPLLLVGFLGGLTTFSSFAVEVLQSWEQQRPFGALLLVALHVVLSLLAALGGLFAVRALMA
jgi:fluoride exporter